MSWARGLGALLGCRSTDVAIPTASRSRSSSSAAQNSLDDSVDGEGDEGEGEEGDAQTHDEINTSQMPDAPQPSQRRGRGTPGKYARKARKDPVIEAASEDEEEEEVPHLRRRRRLTKGKEPVAAKKGKGRK
jgi:hypothetical protein